MKYYFYHDETKELSKEITLVSSNVRKDGVSEYRFMHGDKVITAYARTNGSANFLSFDGVSWRPLPGRGKLKQVVSGENIWSVFKGFLPRKESENSGDGIVTKMPGKVVQIKVKVGDQVEAGQTLVIFEAMKMEQELKAPKAGTIANIHVKEGTPVDQGITLLDIE